MSASFDTGHGDLVHDAQYDFYGKRVATCSSDRAVKVFDVGSNGDLQQSGELMGHEGPVWQVSWAHPQFGSLLASCGYDRRVLVFRETAPGAWLRVFAYEGHASSVNSIAWAPPEFGLHLAAASSDGRCSVLSHRADDDTWDVATLEDCPQGLNAIAWAPPSGGVGASATWRLATAGCDGAVRIHKCRPVSGERWALESLLHRVGAGGNNASREWVRDVAWCPSALGGGVGSSLLLASCSDDGIVCLWRGGGSGSTTSEWPMQALPPFPAPVWRLSWSTTGRLLAVSCADNSVTLWKEDLQGTWQNVSTAPVRC